MFKIIFLLIFLLILISILAFFYSYFYEPFELKLEKKEIFFNTLPSELDGLKIIHFSDLHLRKITRREKEFLEIISQEKPDFIFFTGDFIERERNISLCADYIYKISKINKNFFGVFGNHDHLLTSSFEELEKEFENRGVEILTNESKKIEIKSSYFYLIGVDDPFLGYADLEKASQNIPFDSFKILLAHSPDVIEEEWEKIKNIKIDLILSGHTHGGQINFPILRSIILSLITRTGGKYSKGLYEKEGTKLYVNRGMGTYYLMPLRFNAFPEVTLITLRKI